MTQALKNKRLSRYIVADIDAFFEVYHFEPEEEDAIRERWEDENIIVNQDGSAEWADSEEILTDGLDEPLSDVDFEEEAQLSGTVLE